MFPRWRRGFTYYYLKPRPELVIPSLSGQDKEVQAEGRSLAAEGERGGLRTFYAQIFAHNEPVVADLERALDSLPSAQQTFVRATLRRCAAPACSRVLKERPSPPTPRGVQRSSHARKPPRPPRERRSVFSKKSSSALKLNVQAKRRPNQND